MEKVLKVSSSRISITSMAEGASYLLRLFANGVNVQFAISECTSCTTTDVSLITLTATGGALSSKSALATSIAAVSGLTYASSYDTSSTTITAVSPTSQASGISISAATYVAIASLWCVIGSLAQ